MAFRELRLSTPISVVFIIFALLISGFLLLFGVANLIHPEVPDTYLTRNAVVCLVASGLGILSLLVAVGAIRRLLLKKSA